MRVSHVLLSSDALTPRGLLAPRPGAQGPSAPAESR